MDDVLIAIPTYNERQNIGLLCDQIVSILPSCHIIVLDDSSPDGTGEIVREMARLNPRISLYLRNRKMGIGSAHKDALRQAIVRKADVLVTLDADLTHNPEDIPRLLIALQSADVALGSRFMEGGSLQNWSWIRRAITHCGHFMTKFLLQVSFDATGALRAYRINNWSADFLKAPLHDGYPFLYQSLTWLVRNGAQIAEIPVVLNERAYGSSKMRPRDIVFGIIGLCRFSLIHRASFRNHRTAISREDNWS